MGGGGWVGWYAMVLTKIGSLTAEILMMLTCPDFAIPNLTSPDFPLKFI